MLDSQRNERNSPSAGHVWRWFDPRAKDLGSWAFLLNRLTGLGLTFYLILHLIVLNKLVQGPQAYDAFVQFSQRLIIRLGEVVLITAVVYHGLNGIRVSLHAFGVGISKQKTLIALVVMCTLLAGAIFAARLFGAGAL